MTACRDVLDIIDIKCHRLWIWVSGHPMYAIEVGTHTKNSMHDMLEGVYSVSAAICK
jgi:hypothetical protein